MHTMASGDTMSMMWMGGSVSSTDTEDCHTGQVGECDVGSRPTIAGGLLPAAFSSPAATCAKCQNADEFR